jgi:hypothetical protein
MKAVIAPMIVAAIGILLSIAGVYMVRTREQATQKNLLNALLARYGRQLGPDTGGNSSHGLPPDGSPGVCSVQLSLALLPVLSSASQQNTSHLMSTSLPGTLQNRHSRVRQPQSLKVLPLECSRHGFLSLQLQ